MKENKILQIPVRPRELFGSYQTHHFLFLGLPQLNNFKSIWSFWSLLLRLVRTRTAVSLGLIILFNWGKTLLRISMNLRFSSGTRCHSGLVWAQDSVSACPFYGWFLVPGSLCVPWWPSAGDSRGPLMVSILSASSSPPTQSCHHRPLGSSRWTLNSISSTQVVTRIHPSCSSA